MSYTVKATRNGIIKLYLENTSFGLTTATARNLIKALADAVDRADNPLEKSFDVQVVS